MLKLGDYNKLIVARDSDIGLYLTDDEESLQVLLPRRYCPENAAPGDDIRAFIYKDSEDRLIATTLNPRARVGEFARLRVKQVNNFGAFLDWGLDKDLFLPFKEQRHKVREDDECVVFVMVDEASERLIATTWMNSHFNQDTDRFQPGDQVRILAYARSPMGVAVVVDKQWAGLIHAANDVKSVDIGDERDGYIQKIRPDGKLDVILRKPGYAGAMENADVILDRLKDAGGALPYNAKSAADEIRDAFGMSRKTFKKIIGDLYKKQIIKITENGIKITRKD